MAVTGNGQASFNEMFTYASGFNAGSPVNLARTINGNQFQAGTSADQYDLVGAVRLTFTASTAQTIILTTNLLDPGGSAVAFARIKKLLIKITGPTTDGAYLQVKQGASNGWTNFIDGGAGAGLKLLVPTSNNDAGMWFQAPNTTGWAVSGTNNSLLLTPSAHAIIADILAVGCSA